MIRSRRGAGRTRRRASGPTRAAAVTFLSPADPRVRLRLRTCTVLAPWPLVIGLLLAPPGAAGVDVAPASRVRAEVYWGHADQDQSMTPENMATLDQAMDDAGVRHTTELYRGAQHGYTMADMGAYDEAAAERHFTALFALLQRAIPA